MTADSSADRRRLRSDETRTRLLLVGCRQFATRGYDATTTRALADEAGVNQSAILYHFGGKEGLYLAVADAITERGREAMRPFLPALDAPALTAADARAALGTLLGGIVRGLLTIADDGSAAAFVVREQATPGLAFDRLYAGYIRRLHEHVTAVVATATGRAPDDPTAILDAHAIIGMALGFAVAPETVRRRLGWPAYTEAHVARITSTVNALAQRALGDTAGRVAPRTNRKEQP